MNKVLLSSRALIFSTLIISALSFTVQAAELSPDMQVKLDIYKTKLTEWAKDPIIVKAVLQANSSKANMNNDTWKKLPSSDAKVKPFLTSTAGQKLTAWEKDKSLGKLFLRGNTGNLVAGSKKPAIFNIADRPAFKNAFRGKIWNSSTPKADPTTKVSSIQLSIPVKNNGKEIGVLHTSVIAN